MSKDRAKKMSLNDIVLDIKEGLQSSLDDDWVYKSMLLILEEVEHLKHGGPLFLNPLAHMQTRDAVNRLNILFKNKELPLNARVFKKNDRAIEIRVINAELEKDTDDDGQ